MSNSTFSDEPATAPLATLLLGHGAGAPMDSSFMTLLAQSLAQHGVHVLRFEFPYMQARRVDGRKRPPNPMPALQAHLRELCEGLDAPFFVGGKSMGGRVASMSAGELGARGFICFGYPFHPPSKPEKTRIAHLQQLTCPGLILQGTRDPLGKPEEVASYPLDSSLQLHWLNSGDHDFKPLKASGQTQQQLIEEAAERAADFCRQNA